MTVDAVDRGSSSTASDRVRELALRFARGRIVPKLTVLVVLAGVIRIALRPASVHHDAAMYLQTAELLLQGKHPYVDFIDLNPPLIMYVSVIPVAVARLLGASVAPTALLMTAGAAIVALIATRRVLLASFAENGADPLLAEVAVLALAYAFFLSEMPEWLDVPFPGLPLPDPRSYAIFTQREHLMMIGAAPFVALRFRRWEGGCPGVLSAIFLGAAASLAVCLKPQFVVVPLALELACLARTRKLAPLWAPELAAAAAFAIAYAASFALLPADSRAAWFRRWMPFTIQGYGVFDEHPAWHLIVRCWPALLAAALAFGLRLVGDPHGRRLLRAFAAMALGGAALYVAQRKGWQYHAYPFMVCTIVVVACCVAGARAVATEDDAEGARFVLPVTRDQVGRAFAAAVGLTGVLCIVCLARIDTAKDVERVKDSSQIWATIGALSNEGDAVLVATPALWLTYPGLTILHRNPGSRYLWLFPIPMFRKVHSDVWDLEGDFVRELAEDIRVRKPRLIFLQTGWCYGCGTGTIDGFFFTHPPLAAALAAYSTHGSVKDQWDFQVFVRN